MKHVVIIFLWFIVVVFSQIFIGLLFNNIYTPNLVLLLIIIIGYRFGEIEGSILGFIAGIITSLIWFEPMGISSFVFVVSGYLSAGLRNRLFLDKFWLCLISLFLLIFIVFLLGISFSFVLYNYTFKISFLSMTLDSILLSISFWTYIKYFYKKDF